MTEIAPPKICFVAPNIYGIFNPLSHAPYNGSDANVYELAKFLAGRSSFQVALVTGDYGQEEIEYYSGVLVFRSRFETATTFWQRTLRRPNPFEELLLEINAQVYVVAGAGGLAQVVAEFCNKFGRSFVYRVGHQRDCDGTFVHGSGEEGRRFEWALHQADEILCQTHEQRQMLLRAEQLDSLVLPNLTPLPAPSDLETPRDEVIWVGEIVEWKQPEFFLRLALTVQNQSFTVVAMPRNTEYYERLVSRSRDIPNLGFENHVPYSEMPRFFQSARLLINTSRFEGFPYAMTQAMAYGVPVASLHVDPDGILEKHQLGIYAHGSELQLAQGVQDLITYERQRKRLAANAARYAQEHFGVQSAGSEYARILAKCANSRARAKKFFSI